MVGRTSAFPQALARARCRLALEPDALLGCLGLGRLHFHGTDKDVRACIATTVPHPTHLIVAFAPAALVEMAARLPDFKPLPEIERPFDSPLLGGLALFEEAARARRVAGGHLRRR